MRSLAALLAMIVALFSLPTTACAQEPQAQDTTTETTTSFEMTEKELVEFLVHQVKLKAAPGTMDTTTLRTSPGPFAKTPLLTKIDLPDSWDNSEGFITRDSAFVATLYIGPAYGGGVVLSIHIHDCKLQRTAQFDYKNPGGRGWKLYPNEPRYETPLPSFCKE